MTAEIELEIEPVAWMDVFGELYSSKPSHLNSQPLYERPCAPAEPKVISYYRDIFRRLLNEPLNDPYEDASITVSRIRDMAAEAVSTMEMDFPERPVSGTQGDFTRYLREFVLDWLPSDAAGDDFKARLICKLDLLNTTERR